MTHLTDEELENRNRKASAAMRGMHKTACYEQGDHPDECESYFSLAADALDAVAASQPADPVTNAGSCQPVRVKPLKWEDFANISASPDDDAVMDDNLAVALCSYFDSRMDCPDDEEEGAELDDYGCWRVWVSENAEKVLRRIAKAANDHILAALEAAPHVYETPKSEHDSADVLTALTTTTIDPANVQALVDAATKAKIILAEFEPHPLPVLGELLAALAALKEAAK